LLLHPQDAPVDVCGEYVAAALRDEILPVLTRLLDRREMLAAQDAQDPGMRLDKMSAVLLRLPDGDSPELRARVESLAASSEHWAESDFIAWARERLVRSRAAT
jgi:hypothetical protein